MGLFEAPRVGAELPLVCPQHTESTFRAASWPWEVHGVWVWGVWGGRLGGWGGWGSWGVRGLRGWEVGGLGVLGVSWGVRGGVGGLGEVFFVIFPYPSFLFHAGRGVGSFEDPYELAMVRPRNAG